MRSKGFSLIEISVVLVVIGLLIGGVLVGWSLLRQSQVTSVMKDEQLYVQAAMQFKEKYGYLPGDFPSATTYWGAAGGNGSDNWTTTCYASGSTTSPATCNGNGDGVILGNATYENEMFRAWQHLADAGMIQGSYTGVAGSGGIADHTIGVNCPATRVRGTGFSLFYNGVQTGSASVFDATYNHQMQFGQKISTGGPAAPALTAGEALALDAKYDDGLPASGKMMSYKNGSLQAPSCATTAVSSTAAYNIGSTGVQCSIIFLTGF